MDYKKNDVLRVSVRYNLMNEIARRKNCWNPKPSKHESEAMKKWEDKIQAWIELLYDSECEYIYNNFEWE